MDWYLNFVASYWWAMLIICLLLVIVAHIPNFVDFHYIDLYIPAVLVILLIIALALKWIMG